MVNTTRLHDKEFWARPGWSGVALSPSDPPGRVWTGSTCLPRRADEKAGTSTQVGGNLRIYVGEGHASAQEDSARVPKTSTKQDGRYHLTNTRLFCTATYSTRTPLGEAVVYDTAHHRFWYLSDKDTTYTTVPTDHHDKLQIQSRAPCSLKSLLCNSKFSEHPLLHPAFCLEICDDGRFEGIEGKYQSCWTRDRGEDQVRPRASAKDNLITETMQP